MAEGFAAVDADASIATDGNAAMIRVDALRGVPELVEQLGGDADALFARFRLNRSILDKRHAMIPYRTMVHVLERASVELDCPDFGMRLADLQCQANVFGPLGIAVANAPDLREAFRYCCEHLHAFTTGTQMSFRKISRQRTSFMGFEILLSRLPYQRQATEQGLLLLHRCTVNLARGQVKAREISFTHEPLAPMAAYRKYFDCPLAFGRSMNGVMFADADLDTPIIGHNPQLFELAASFIEQRYPSTRPMLSARVRSIIERQMLQRNCTFAETASALGMHTRTLQRRLKAEGETFETIKDGVRRDMAQRYLKQSTIPLVRVAEILGYSETSVLSRSCFRWFSASPRQLRGGRPSSC